MHKNVNKTASYDCVLTFLTNAGMTPGNPFSGSVDPCGVSGHTADRLTVDLQCRRRIKFNRDPLARDHVNALFILHVLTREDLGEMHQGRKLARGVPYAAGQKSAASFPGRARRACLLRSISRA